MESFGTFRDPSLEEELLREQAQRDEQTLVVPDEEPDRPAEWLRAFVQRIFGRR